MFLEQGIQTAHPFSKYLLGSFIVFLASQLGSIPLVLVGVLNSIKTGKITSNSDDLLKSIEPNLSLALAMFMFVCSAIALFLVIKYFHQQSIRSVTTSRKKVDFGRIFFSFTVWGTISICSVLGAYFMTDTDVTVQFQPAKFAILFLISIVLIPIQTSTEEYIFRGYLMQGFAGLAKNRWFPLVMTSIIFGGMHVFNPEVSQMGYFVMVYYIGTGFFLGILTLMDEGMELALGFHAANNLIGALLVTSDSAVFKTYAVFKDNSVQTAGFDTIVLPVFVLFPLLLYVFSKKYQWSNWKQKLTGKITLLNATQHD
jgi:uncharacterized protein